MKKEILVTNKKYKEQSGMKYSIPDKDTLILEASNYADNWLLENCRPLKIRDTGNNCVLTLDNKKIALDYSVLHDLYVLLHLYHKNFEGTDLPEIYEIKKI